MKKLNLKPLTKVEIEWVDAWAGDQLHQATIAEILADFKIYLRHTIGYFVGEKEDHIIFATDWDGETNVGGPQQIPMGMVRKITPLIGKSTA